MNKFARIFTVLALALCLILAFAACDENNNNDDSSPAQTTATGNTSTPSLDVTPDGGDGNGVEFGGGTTAAEATGDGASTTTGNIGVGGVTPGTDYGVLGTVRPY